MKRTVIAIGALIFLSTPFVVSAQSAEIVQDDFETVLAKVVSIESQHEEKIPGTDSKTNIQVIKVELLEGKLKGQTVEIKNDYMNLKVGEKFYTLHTTDWETGKDYFSVQEKYRLPSLMFLIALFVIAVLFFGGTQGLRGLLSLIGSLLLIVFVLLPGIIKGVSPILLTLIVSSIIIILGSYITHGFNKTTTSAVVGMILTVIITGVLAYFAVRMTGLSGYESEEAVYLHFNSSGGIDILGLLFSGIIIGLLGVLYDAAISQAIAVEELWKIAPHVSSKDIYIRAIRIGREHIGALVDTLAIAYVGASLPLLLLFYQSSVESPLTTINREIFATEIVRTMIGSIGLILAVPITTLVCVRMIRKRNAQNPTDIDLEKEKKNLDHAESHHHH
jgi:uncharacterized membrane protein